MALLKEDLYYIIKENLKLEDFEFISFENSNLEKNSTGFLSDQAKKCIKYKIRGKEEELFVFIKQLPHSEYHKKNIIGMGSFQRESLVFADILADFEEFAMPIPKCYLIKLDGTIVFEDLTLKGYRNKNLYETLDLKHCEAVLESMAKLHAASFIIEERKRCRINDKYPIIETEVLMNGDPDHPGHRCTMAGVRGMKGITEQYLPHYPAEVTSKVFDYLENIFDKFGRSGIYPNALSHSDLWGNNIMYKYDKRGNLEQACIVDFQLTTYKPPAFDILFFLHNCTTKEFRNTNQSNLLKHYFNFLTKQLALSNIKLDTIMSWSDFEEMLKDALPVVLGKTPLYLTFVLMPDNILKDVNENDEKFKIYFEDDRTKFVLQAMKECKHFNERTLECMTELFDYFTLH